MQAAKGLQLLKISPNSVKATVHIGKVQSLYLKTAISASVHQYPHIHSQMTEKQIEWTRVSPLFGVWVSCWCVLASALWLSAAVVTSLLLVDGME